METATPSRKWGQPYEVEKRRRIQLTVMAYAYEFMDDPIVDDNTYDWLARKVDIHQETGNLILDAFFFLHYSPMTGMWVRDHPDLPAVERAYRRYRHYNPR